MLILKIIGILLLLLFGFFLTLTLTILLVPLRYQIFLAYHEKLKARISVSWLFRFFQWNFLYEDEPDMDVQILWFHPLAGKTAAEKAESTISQIPPKIAQECDKVSVEVQKKSEVQEKKSSEDERKRQTERQTEHQPETKETPVKRWKRMWTDLQKNYQTYRRFLTDEQNQKAFFLLLKQSRVFLHHILPQKIRLQAEFGFDDPATTGNLLAVFSILYAFYGDTIEVVPHFEEEILQGEFEASGRVRIGTLLFLAVRVWFDKNFRILRKRFTETVMNGKEMEE